MERSVIKTKTIEYNGRNITVNELTVAQVDEWMGSQKDGEAVLHTLDLLMGRKLPVSVIRLAVPELTAADLKVAPSELVALYDAVEEINSFLSEMSVRLAGVEKVLKVD